MCVSRGLFTAAIVTGFLLATGCHSGPDPSPNIADTHAFRPVAVDGAMVIAEASFVGADGSHQGSGTAAIIRLPTGEMYLAVANFRVTPGPDLVVLLAQTEAPSSQYELGDSLDLGWLASFSGDQSYLLPAEMDPAAYKSVVIYCRALREVFSTATFR